MKNSDVVFTEDGMSVEKTLEMHPNERNEGLTTVVVNVSSKSSLSDDGDKRDEQVEDHLVVNEETIKISAENDGSDEKFGKD